MKKDIIKKALFAFITVIIAIPVVALGTALYVWVMENVMGEAFEKIALDTASSDSVSVSMSDGDNLADDNASQTVSSADIPIYTQEQLDQLISSALASKEMEVQRQLEQLNATKTDSEILEGIKQGLSDGSTVIETLRPYYPDHLIVASGGVFHFVPINRELKMNTYTQENLNILENGEYQYFDNPESKVVVSHKGIDVSSHQGAINWKSVAEDGVEFAFIRSAFRGYGSGKLVEDENFNKNIQGALDEDICVGVYVFSQAINEAEVIEEAKLIMSQVDKYGINAPIVIDVERVDSNTGRMNLISVEERTNIVKTFCETVKNSGYKPMIYHNTEMAALMIDISQFEEYDKWYASYSETMFYPYKYDIWQYTAKGKVKGINTAVDMNICFTDLWNN